MEKLKKLNNVIIKDMSTLNLVLYWYKFVIVDHDANCILK